MLKKRAYILLALLASQCRVAERPLGAAVMT